MVQRASHPPRAGLARNRAWLSGLCMGSASRGAHAYDYGQYGMNTPGVRITAIYTGSACCAAWRGAARRSTLPVGGLIGALAPLEAWWAGLGVYALPPHSSIAFAAFPWVPCVIRPFGRMPGRMAQWPLSV
jgi:hypothetical protein